MAKFSAPTLNSTIKIIKDKGQASLDRAIEGDGMVERGEFMLAPMIYEKSCSPAVEGIGVRPGKVINIATMAVIRMASIEVRGESLEAMSVNDAYIVPTTPGGTTSDSIREFTRAIPGHVDRISSEIGKKVTLVGMEMKAIPEHIVLYATDREKMIAAWESAEEEVWKSMIAVAEKDSTSDQLFQPMVELPSMVNIVAILAVASDES